MTLIETDAEHDPAVPGDAEVEDPVEWEMHLVHRTGAPPLRFSGRLVYYDTMGDVEAEIYVGLWEKRRNGFVIDHALPRELPPGRAAISVRSLPEAIDALEAFCQALQGSSRGGTLSDKGLDATLCAIVAEQLCQSRVQDFLNLSGLALAQWDEWCSATGSERRK